METVAKRVDRLEQVMIELAEQSKITQLQVARLSIEMLEFKDEMRAFKDEMRAFKDEMRAFKDEMRAFKDEMKAFKDEMLEFKDEMRAFKDEMREFKDGMNKRWGELANKMGTLVEDIFIPSFDIMLKRYFGVTPKRTGSRMKLRNENREIELDIVGFTEDKVFIVEVKSSPDRQGYVEEFIEKLRVLPEFLPEIESYEAVPIYAGLSMSENTIEYLTKNNIYALIVKGDILEIANFDKVKRTEEKEF